MGELTNSSDSATTDSPAPSQQDQPNDGDGSRADADEHAEEGDESSEEDLDQAFDAAADEASYDDDDSTDIDLDQAFDAAADEADWDSEGAVTEAREHVDEVYDPEARLGETRADIEAGYESGEPTSSSKEDLDSAAAPAMESHGAPVTDTAEAPVRGTSLEEQGPAEEVAKEVELQQPGPAAGFELQPPAQAPDAVGKPELSPEQAAFAEAEIRTDVGSAYFDAGDTTFQQAAKDVPAYPGEYVIDTHGTDHSVQLVDSEDQLSELGAGEFAEVVRESGWDGEPIRLFSCDTGSSPDGFAQQLADELDVPVTAPTAPVSTFPSVDGQTFEPVVGDLVDQWDPDTGEVTQVFVPGEWVTFHPSDSPSAVSDHERE